jgi:hypothetical protein
MGAEEWSEVSMMTTDFASAASEKLSAMGEPL